MKSLMFALLLMLLPATASAQCIAPGCEEATAVVSAARATARAVLTREAQHMIDAGEVKCLPAGR